MGIKGEGGVLFGAYELPVWPVAGGSTVMAVGGRVHTVTHNEAPASAAQDVVHLQHPHVVYFYLLPCFHHHSNSCKFHCNC